MSATYAQRLDDWAESRGGSWKVWSAWSYVEPFERWLFWFGEAKNGEGEVVASVDRLRTENPYNGQARTTRLLWNAVSSTSDAVVHET